MSGLTSPRFADRKCIGFWAEKKGDATGLPWPGDFVDAGWSISHREYFANYLDAAPSVEFWRGPSRCRLCGERNGTTDKSDGVYLWPEGFGHYVREHGVKPPADFMTHVFAQQE